MAEPSDTYRKTFTPNPSQEKVNALAWQDPYVENLLAYGPSRSGKSANFVSLIVNRAIAFPGTKHAIFRLTMRSCRAHLFNGTFPEVMNMLYPGYLDSKSVDINRAESWIQFHNGSKIVFEGLDPNNIDKVLGAQYATAWVNECNEVPDYEIIQQLASRMADTAPMVDPATNKPVLGPDGAMVMCRPLMLFDCNPDVKTDWDYKCFVEKVHPASGKKFADLRKWRRVFLPAHENADNLAKGYLDSLAERYDGSPNMASRFLEGQWRDDNPNALFRKSMFKYREVAKEMLARIVVAVDPAGSHGNNSDQTGIVVVGLGFDGCAYILEDASDKLPADQWARKVISLYDKWEADCIVAETNYGGDMVRNTIQQARRNVPFKAVRASRSKLIRAEPVAEAYHAQKVFHTETFKELEAQMCSYKPEVSKKSPDRLDALVWGVTEILKIGGNGGGQVSYNTRGSIFR